MNKKGMVFWLIIDLLIAFIVVFFFFLFVKEKIDFSLFLKTKLARDFAIETNTLYAVPGDVYFKYPQNISDYIVKFDNGIVRVYEEIILMPSYPYAEFGEYNIEYKKEKKIDFLIFKKKKKKISFEEYG